MTYRPNPETLAGRVLGFLALHPHEELTFDDIVSRFVEPGDSRNVHTQLIAALDHDMLTYDSEDDVYRKGPASLPAARALDDGDDGTGNVDTVTVKAPRKARAAAPKVAARAPASIFPPAQDMQAQAAIKDEAKPAVEHQQLAGPFDVLGRIPARTQGAADAMDRAGVGGDTPALPDTDGAAADAPPARPNAQGRPTEGIGAEDSEAREHAQVRAAHRIGADGPRAPDPQGDEHGTAEERLEARGGDRVGGSARPDTAGHGADGEGRQQAPNDGQPWPVHEGRPLGTGDGAAPASGDHEVGPAERPDHASNSAAGEAAGGGMIHAVRQHLLETLKDLRNPDRPMQIDRAKAVAEVATVLVNSAKVEVEYLKVTQQRRGAFFEALPAPGGEA